MTPYSADKYESKAFLSATACFLEGSFFNNPLDFAKPVCLASPATSQARRLFSARRAYYNEPERSPAAKGRFRVTEILNRLFAYNRQYLFQYIGIGNFGILDRQPGAPKLAF